MKKILILLVLFLVISIYSFAAENKFHVGFSSEGVKFSFPFGKSYNYADIRVTRVVDGDTLVLESGERVRLIGIDAPEMHESEKLFRDSYRTKKDVATIKRLGKASYEFLKKLVEGKRVTLEFDVEKYDRYNRLLAYVYLKDDGTFINAKILEEGYAQIMTVPPNVKYKDLFLELARQAREQRKGLWKEE
ncbi:MAG: thermonuclease family protein [Candidatus Omnitrophica bacterium]|nr:thermonuclease family protein [Candidatus Omnitrophota bacterium]